MTHLITSREVSLMMGHGPLWFSRDRVRKRLNAKGFPQPVERGRWLRTAVEAWLHRVGNQTLAAAPARNRRTETRP